MSEFLKLARSFSVSLIAQDLNCPMICFPPQPCCQESGTTLAWELQPNHL